MDEWKEREEMKLYQQKQRIKTTIADFPIQHEQYNHLAKRN
jgi:hypothetical protein